MPPYDAKLIQQVLGKVRSLPQMTPQDRSLLFPPQYQFDLIADPPVVYRESGVVNHRFKGMMSPQPLPLSITLFSDYSESDFEFPKPAVAKKRGLFAHLIDYLYFRKPRKQEPEPVPTKTEPKHYLTVSHTLDPRASPDFATIRTYPVDQQYADEIARLHRAFYSGQDARHVLELNHALERRQLVPAGYSQAYPRRKRRGDDNGLAPTPTPRNDDGRGPPAPMYRPNRPIAGRTEKREAEITA